MQRVIGKMIIHFVFNLKKKVKDMKDKIKSITHIQKDESMKVKSIKGKKQNKKRANWLIRKYAKLSTGRSLRERKIKKPSKN